MNYLVTACSYIKGVLLAEPPKRSRALRSYSLNAPSCALNIATRSYHGFHLRIKFIFNFLMIFMLFSVGYPYSIEGTIIL